MDSSGEERSRRSSDGSARSPSSRTASRSRSWSRSSRSRSSGSRSSRSRSAARSRTASHSSRSPELSAGARSNGNGSRATGPEHATLPGRAGSRPDSRGRPGSKESQSPQKPDRWPPALPASPSERSASGAQSAADRPMDLELHGDLIGNMPQSPTRTSTRGTLGGHSSSANSGGTPTSGAEVLNEFQLYKKFRLIMVKKFGSLASALYELGFSAESGEMTKEQFERVLSEQLRIFTLAEATALFSHVSFNADALDLGESGLTTSVKDFGIPVKDWLAVVNQKRLAEAGGSDLTPFASGPSGRNMGVYPRNVTLQSVIESKEQIALTEETQELPSHAEGDDSPTTSKDRWQASSLRTPRSKTSTGRSQRFNWMQRQQPWQRSMFGSEKFDGPMFRTDYRKLCCADRAKSSDGFSPGFAYHGPKAALRPPRKESQQKPMPAYYARPRSARDNMRGLADQACPTRRAEMEPAVCERQVWAWWPYAHEPPRHIMPLPNTPRLRLKPADPQRNAVAQRQRHS